MTGKQDARSPVGALCRRSRLLARLSMAAAVLTVCDGSAASNIAGVPAIPNVAGTWIFTANASQSPSLDNVAIALQQSGIVLSGTGQGSAATGFVTEDSVRINLFHANRWELRGTVSGNTMTGSARWGVGNDPITMDGGTWTAVRQ